MKTVQVILFTLILTGCIAAIDTMQRPSGCNTHCLAGIVGASYGG